MLRAWRDPEERGGSGRTTLHRRKLSRGLTIVDLLEVGIDASVLERVFAERPPQPEDGELSLGDAGSPGLR
jgi:hypothetical protein